MLTIPTLQEALPRTKYHRDMRALLLSAEDLHEKAKAFWADHDDVSLWIELHRAGVVTSAQIGGAEYRAVDDEARVVDDVKGFIWALEMFLSVLDSNVQPANESPLPNAPADEDDPAPCAVVVAKGGA